MRAAEADALERRLYEMALPVIDAAIEKAKTKFADEIAAAIEATLCEPQEQCADRFCPDCIKYEQNRQDAALVRRLGGVAT